MYLSHGEWGWGAGLVMVALSVAFWVFVIWLVLTLVRANSSKGDPERDVDPEQVLARRFAAGDIDEDEYQHRLEVLRRGRSASGALRGRT